jgi:zinc protease
VFVQGGYDGRRDGGVFYTAVATSPGVDSVKIERALIAEVEKLAAEPVEGAELERARRQAESNLLFGWQASWSRAQALGTAQMVNGDWRAAWDRLDQYRKLTPAQIERAAAAVLKPEGRAIVWLAPAKPAGGTR